MSALRYFRALRLGWHHLPLDVAVSKVGMAYNYSIRRASGKLVRLAGCHVEARSAFVSDEQSLLNRGDARVSIHSASELRVFVAD